MKTETLHNAKGKEDRGTCRIDTPEGARKYFNNRFKLFKKPTKQTKA